MTQLDSLYQFVKSNLPARLMDTAGADSWMDDITLIRTSKDLGLGQQRIGLREYSGVLAWERWPYRERNPDELFALVNVWLDAFGNELRSIRSLDDPDVHIEIRDNQSAIVMVTVPLVDDIVLVPDENGPIPMRGQRYRLAKPTVYAAEDAWIYGTGVTAPVAGEPDAR